MDAELHWMVPTDHPAFAGHFPGRPIVPGVVLLDRALRFAAAATKSPVAGWQIGNAKFYSPVGPGEALHFALQRKPSGALSFTVRSGDREVAAGTLTPPAA